MMNRNAFVTGAGLLAGYILIEFLCSSSLSHDILPYCISDHFGEIIPVVRYLAIAGCLLLIYHHYQASTEERETYRYLDRFLALSVITLVLKAFNSILLTPSDWPSDYVGYLLCLEYARKALWALMAVFWGFFLWRGKMQKAMMFSVLFLACSLLPIFPANNPLLQKQLVDFLSRTPLVDTPDPAMQEGQDQENATENTETETTSDSAHTPIYTSYVIFLGPPMYILLCIYTWMRGTNRCYPKTVETPRAGCRSLYRGGSAYRKGEAILLLFPPGYMVFTLLLPWLPLNDVFFSGNTITWVHLGLTGLLLLGLAGLLRGIDEIPEKRIHTTDFYIRILLLLLMLSFLLAMVGAIWNILYFLFGGMISEFDLLPGYSLIYLVKNLVVACVGFYALRLWRKGIDKKHALRVLIGATLVVCLATQSNDTLSNVKSSMISDEARVAQSTTPSIPPQEESYDPQGNISENQSSPSPIGLYLSSRLLHCSLRITKFYLIILLLFTMVRWGGYVASKKEDEESDAAACEMPRERWRISHKRDGLKIVCLKPMVF